MVKEGFELPERNRLVRIIFVYHIQIVRILWFQQKAFYFSTPHPGVELKKFIVKII